MKFSTKLTILISGIIVSMGMVISYLVYASSIAVLENLVKDRLKNQAFHTMHKIDMMLFERYEDIRAIATDPVISSRVSTPRQITERLIQFKNDRGYDSLAFYDLNKVCIAETSGKNIGRQHFPPSKYWKDIDEGKDVAIDVLKSDFLNKNIFRFASVVKERDGVVIGFVVSRLLVESLHEIVKQAVGIYDVEDFSIDLLNKDGLILYSNYNEEGVLRDSSPNFEIVKIALTAGIKADSIKHVHLEEEILAFVHQNGYKGFGGAGWTLIIEVPTRVASAPAVELRNRVMFIFFLLTVFVFPIIFFSSRKVSDTIERLSVASDEVGKGDLDVVVDVASKDETGRLAESFNGMVSELKESRERLLGYSMELETRVVERTAELQDELAKRKRMEDELLKARELESIGILAAGIAHDFNNLLTAILGNISFAKMQINAGSKDKIIDMLKRAEHVCEDAVDLSSRFVTFAKGGAPSKEKTSILPILKETATLALSGSNIAAEFILSDDLYFVEIDERQIKQAVNNVVMNAREAMPDGGVVKVSAKNVAVSKNDNLPLKEGNYIKISIEDTGKGIPKENIAKIFAPYFSTKEMGTTKGQGLGLTICHSIIKRHDGHIAVESELGKGTTFHIYLPAA